MIDGAVVEEEEEEEEAGGVVMVKIMARGKQRRRAHMRENGVGDSMIGRIPPLWDAMMLFLSHFFFFLSFFLSFF